MIRESPSVARVSIVAGTCIPVGITREKAERIIKQDRQKRLAEARGYTEVHAAFDHMMRDAKRA